MLSPGTDHAIEAHASISKANPAITPDDDGGTYRSWRAVQMADAQ
jgi:hypothetical protein